MSEKETEIEKKLECFGLTMENIFNCAFFGKVPVLNTKKGPCSGYQHDECEGCPIGDYILREYNMRVPKNGKILNE